MLRRRGIQWRRAMLEQLARGRPHASWRRCNDDGCTSTRCAFEEPRAVFAAVRRQAKVRVGQRNGELLALLSESLPGGGSSTTTTAAAALRTHRLKGFVKSPPVQGALCEFFRLCRRKALDPTPEALAVEMTEAAPSCEALARELGPVAAGKGMDDRGVHRYLCREDRFLKSVRKLGLRQLVLRYFAVVESWRRHMVGRGADWGLGSGAQTAEVIGAILLNAWILRREGHLRVVFVKSVIRNELGELWGAWLEHYHPLTVMDSGGGDAEASSESMDPNDEEDGADGARALPREQKMQLFMGVGRGAIPWTSARMRRATGAEVTACGEGGV
jgi:hypothetical protein